MDSEHYNEMVYNLERLLNNGILRQSLIYIFGHCNASEELADWLLERNFSIIGILDNNKNKQGEVYKKIPIILPECILQQNAQNILVCIASRAYDDMKKQLAEMGFKGRTEKLVNYNSFVEYSFTKETIRKRLQLVNHGIQILDEIIRKMYHGRFIVICPFHALGDVYYAMSYLPHFLRKKSICDYVVITVKGSCSDVAKLFAPPLIEVLNQDDMDFLVQAVLYTNYNNVIVAHHDRLYTNPIMKALYIKCIPFEAIYRCGVFGLERDTIPQTPLNVKRSDKLCLIKKGKAVILAPYAKSVVEIPLFIWKKIIEYYKKKGYQIFTNVSSKEQALLDTIPISASLLEIQSIVEWAGTFIGIRSGLCDVILTASCRKIVLFSDCYYSDTCWKIADFFYLQGWENIIVRNMDEK